MTGSQVTGSQVTGSQVTGSQVAPPPPRLEQTERGAAPVVDRGRRRTAARIDVAAGMWWLTTALTFGAVLLLAVTESTGEAATGYWLNNAVGALVFGVVGRLITTRRRGHPIGRLFAVAGLLYGVAAFAWQYGIYALLVDPGVLPGGAVAIWLASWVWLPAGSSVLLAFLHFPDGRLPSGRWRPVRSLAVLLIAATTASIALRPGLITGALDAVALPNPVGLERAAAPLGTLGAVSMPLLGATALASVAAVLLRLRGARGDERQQVKWGAYAIAVFAVAVLASSVSTAVDQSLPGRLLFLAGFLAVPVAFGVAILRHRLWDIDHLINRTVVYGLLTGVVVGIYVLVVGYLGAAFRTGGNLAISLVATGLVAVAFAPLRERVQRGVNRVMYGQRDDPYAVISSLGERLEATLAPEAALPTVVETVATALKLPYVAVRVAGNDSSPPLAAHGTPPSGEVVRLPLVTGGEVVAELVAAPRSPGESFSAADQQLLRDLARHAGTAVQVARLTDDLQRSREQLVTAREEERRRLRRDLHDGLGPRLAAQTLIAGSARSLYPRDPGAADALLGQLEADTETTLAEVRRLVHGLRPPALDELGLGAALQESAARYSPGGPAMSVELPEELPPLPAAVEVAAYWIAQEAMTNAVRHARATSCRIRLSTTGRSTGPAALVVEVSDDGGGLPANRTAGVGLHSMRERAAELGGRCSVEPSPAGGTRVVAHLPFGPVPENGADR